MKKAQPRKTFKLPSYVKADLAYIKRIVQTMGTTRGPEVMAGMKEIYDTADGLLKKYA